MTDFLEDMETWEPRTKDVVRNGRYMLPHRDGRPKSRGWMRATNLAGAFADQRELQVWDVRMNLLGVYARPDIADQMIAEKLDGMEPGKIRELFIRYSELFKEAAKATVGRNRGTLRHAMVEADYAGMPMNTRPRLALQRGNYHEQMHVHGLRPVPGLVERIVLHEEFGVAGKLDVVLWDEIWGIHRVGDLKTQKRFYTWLNIVIQQWIYATAPVIWDEKNVCWVDTPVAIDPSVALIAHMPDEHREREGGVDLYEVDIHHGRRLATLAHQIVQERAAAKSTRTPWGRLRPVSTDALSLTERYAGRLKACASYEEIMTVWDAARIAGAAMPALAQVAREQKNLVRAVDEPR